MTDHAAGTQVVDRAESAHRADDGHAHDHARGMIFGERSELIFAGLSGLFLGTGFILATFTDSPRAVEMAFYWLAFGFGAAEWARAVLFTGFPWNAIGQAAMPVPLLMQSAAVMPIASCMWMGASLGRIPLSWAKKVK